MPSQNIPNDPNRSVLEQMNDDTVGVVWDRGEPNSVRGLHLRTFSSGRKVFYFKYQTRSKQDRRPKIGEGITLGEARKIARHLREQVMTGLDPKGDWDAAKEEKTVDEVFKILFKEYWDTERFRLSGRTNDVLSYYKKIENKLGHKKLSDVRFKEVRMWHSMMSDTPVMANRALTVLNMVFQHAFDNEWCKINPCLSVKAFSEKKRKRVPTEEELRNILGSLFAIAKDVTDKDRFAAIYILALFYTGSRPQLLTDAKWEHVTQEVDGGVKIELKGKMSYKYNEDETTFIPKQIMDLLNLYEKRPDGKIFTGNRTRALWENMMSEFEYEDLWARDARKAFASLALKGGIPLGIVGQALNHKSPQTTQRYALEIMDSNVSTTNTVANELDKLVEGK